MEIDFSDKDVRDLCSSRSSLVHSYGADLARLICCRLSVLSAAPSIGHLPTEPPIGLVRTDGNGSYSVALGATHILVFSAMTARPIADPSKVTRILIGSPGIVPLAPKGKIK